MKKGKKSESVILKIGGLWSRSEGTIEKLEFNQEIKFDESEIKAISPFKADVMLAKLRHEISVIISNAEIEVEIKCERCLKPFKFIIKIKSAERQFLDKEPEKETDTNDIFLINIRDLEIDLYEMIRQEIILHFPLISVCSKSCKGLCSQCGVDKNKIQCKCREEDTDTQKPFKDLKNIISKPSKSKAHSYKLNKK